MRIVQVVHEFPPDAWAGTDLVTLYLSQALRARGHEVTVLARTADPTAAEFSLREEQMDGLAVVRIINNHTQTGTFRLFYDNTYFNDPFRDLLDRLRPDVVHFQHLAHLSVNLIPLAASLGYPTVLSLHDFFFPCHRIHLINAEQRLCPGPERGERCVSCLRDIAPAEDVLHRFTHMEQVLQTPDVILAPSVFLAQKILEHFPGLKSRLRVMPLGVKPVPVLPRTRETKGPLKILYAGLLFPPKGAHVLIEALQGLPTDAIEVSLYGAVLPFWQPYVGRLREAARELLVHFYDAYPHEQLATILSQHDVLVMPMICEETFSLLTYEALMSGLPVVAAKRGALPDIVQDGVNGLLFEPENTADLRRCLARLISEPGLLDQLRPVNPQIKTMDDYERKMEGLYGEIFARHVHRRMQGDTKNVHISLSSSTLPSVSVLLPTKNGEKYLSEVLEGIRKQQGHFRLREIIAVDSGSRDRTLEILRVHGITPIQIPPHEFGHGKTRNLAASRAQGDYLVFLTQDATPADEHWLENLLAPLRIDPLIAGVYSRHRPRPGCHPMEWHRIVEYELHGRPESRIHSAVDNPDYACNPFLYRFFANTSSVIQRAVWEQIPFPEVEFAEDQAWAERVLQAGYKTAYTADSVVFHSHSYGPWTNFCRHFEHIQAMCELFGQPRQLALCDCVSAAVRVARADLAFWYHQTGQSKARVLARWALPAISWHVAANLGIWLGERADRLPPGLVRLLSLQERIKRR
jgi:rhamnosyltransferase